MTQWLLPRFLMPEYTWPNDVGPPSRNQMPATSQPTRPFLRRFWGFLHYYMRRFSRSYRGWVGIPYDNQIAQLPFGRILKWSDGTRIEEVLAMQIARRAGLPVPRVLCYGEHLDTPHAPVSILMTRVPGEELGQVYETLSNEDKESISQELKGYLEVIRGWQNPWGGNRICSLLGTAVRSVRIPNHYAGPFECEQEFNEYLIQPSWSGGFSSEMAFNDALACAKLMHKLSHPIVLLVVILNPIISWLTRGGLEASLTGNPQAGTMSIGTPRLH